MIKSKRQFPDLPHFASLIEWKLPSLFRTRTKLARALTINDLAKIAKKKVPKVVFDYVEGSALDEVSYARSKAAFDQVEFTAHTLRDVSKVDPSIEIFGKKKLICQFYFHPPVTPDLCITWESLRWQMWQQKII